MANNPEEDSEPCEVCSIKAEYAVDGECLKKDCPIADLLECVEFRGVPLWDGKCFMPKGLVYKYIRIR